MGPFERLGTADEASSACNLRRPTSMTLSFLDLVTRDEKGGQVNRYRSTFNASLHCKQSLGAKILSFSLRCYGHCTPLWPILPGNRLHVSAKCVVAEIFCSGLSAAWHTWSQAECALYCFLSEQSARRLFGDMGRTWGNKMHKPYPEALQAA